MKVRALIVVSALAGGVSAARPTHTSSVAQPPPYEPLNLYSLLHRDDLVATIERRHRPDTDWAGHVERVTRGLVAAPYLPSPLGEGRGIDRDPRFRLDAFDCTTLVETALALAHCDDLDELPALLDRIRYADGRASYQTRRHLMTSQWIPGLVAEGLVRDITRAVGGAATRVVDLRLTKKRWQRRRVARSLPLEADRVPYGRYLLPYIPIADAQARVDRVPAGTIVNVIRANYWAAPDVVTHQGIVVTRPGSRIRLVRHASPVSKRVIDESLEHMLRRYLRPRKWPIIGINLLAMVPSAAAEEMK